MFKLNEWMNDVLNVEGFKITERTYVTAPGPVRKERQTKNL